MIHSDPARLFRAAATNSVIPEIEHVFDTLAADAEWCANLATPTVWEPCSELDLALIALANYLTENDPDENGRLVFEPPAFVSVKEAARIVGVSESTIRYRVHSGALRAQFPEDGYGMSIARADLVEREQHTRQRLTPTERDRIASLVNVWGYFPKYVADEYGITAHYVNQIARKQKATA